MSGYSSKVLVIECRFLEIPVLLFHSRLDIGGEERLTRSGHLPPSGLLHECKRQTCVTCVPVVVAAGPGQLRAEGKDQVEQGPGQNDDVGHTAVENDQLTSVANTCTGGHGQNPDLSQSWSVKC